MSALVSPHTTTGTLAVTVRALSASDAEAFRRVRLEALENEGRYFTADYGKESHRTAAEWASVCTETAGRVIFAALAKNEIVGVVAATRWEGDQSGRTVLWGSAYIRPEWRRIGVGHVLYEAREDWSRKRGFEEAVFTIRADNFRSISVHVEHGAKQVKTEPMRFADGSVAPAIWHSKSLCPG